MVTEPGSALTLLSVGKDFGLQTIFVQAKARKNSQMAPYKLEISLTEFTKK